MSDYLNNLVARTLNLATVVQPRLPSLFEASVANGFALSHEFEATSEDLSARSPAPQISSADSSETQPTQPRMSVTAEPGAQSDVPRSRPQVASSETSKKAKEKVIPLASPAIQAPRVSAPLDIATATPTATPPAPPQAKILIRPLPRVATREPTSQSDAPRRQPLTANVRPPVETRPAQPLPSLTTVTAAQEQQNGPVTSRRMVIGRPAPAAEPPQTISVTIGRVDVRAVFPQPPAPRVSGTPKPAAMSLDEYLKQRSEGRR